MPRKFKFDPKKRFNKKKVFTNKKKKSSNSSNKEDDERGNHAKTWQFPLRDDKFLKLMRDLVPSVPFTPKEVKELMNPPDTLEDIINAKYADGTKKMTSKDKIILDNIKRTKKAEIDHDMTLIKNNGFRVHPKTKEGKELQLCMILQYAVEKSNNDLIANCFIKMMGRTLSSENLNKFEYFINRMNTIVADLDIIKLQFTKFSNQLPPLDRTQFILDEWQKQVIRHIDNKDSMIVMCPTSAGKTVLSTYVSSCDGRILFVVPTEPLAMQVGAHFTKALGQLVAIETDNTHSIADPVKNATLLREAPAVVGTPLAIEKALTEIGTGFSYVIYDEIHNLDGEQGEAIERITKIMKRVPFLALSATIGNIEDLTNWWQSFTDVPIHNVSYTGRFFNLQKCIYNQDENLVDRINPLSMVSIDDFVDGSIVRKNLQMTPSDIWDFIEKIMSVIDLEDLAPDNYFDRTVRLELKDCNDYLFLVLAKLSTYCNESEDNKTILAGILLTFQHNTEFNSDINIMDFVLNLRDNNLIPAICFQLNNISCYKIAMDLLFKLEKAEEAKYPDRNKELEKQMKEWKKWSEKNDKDLADMSEKQLVKKLEQGDDSIAVEKPVLGAPHRDFIVTKNTTIPETQIEEFKRTLRFSFKGYGDQLHPIIRALYRGIGLYIEGMPNTYLRIVQQLAQQKKLGVVFSDSQLAYGVSMPFKTSCIIKNPYGEDTMDPLVNMQASGRAGRRGLDTEGFVIYAGYDWNEVVDLSISPLPSIQGRNYFHPMVYLNQVICDSVERNYNDKKDNKYNYIKPITSDTMINPLNHSLADSSETFYQVSENNLTNSDRFSWCYDNSETENALIFNKMVWELGRKYPTNSICIPYIIKFLERKFANVNHTLAKEQIRISQYLAHFINQVQTTEASHQLIIDDDCLVLMNNLIDKGVDIVNHNIDNRVWKSIEKNVMVDTNDDFEKYQLSQRIWHFGENIRILQNYCYYTKRPLVKLLGKLFTRIWWIYSTATTNIISEAEN